MFCHEMSQIVVCINIHLISPILLDFLGGGHWVLSFNIVSKSVVGGGIVCHSQCDHCRRWVSHFIKLCDIY